MRVTVAPPGTVLPLTRKPKTHLAPVVKTRMLRGRRGLECWGAQTTDGVWGMDRLEDTGTTWEVVNKPTETVVCDYLGSLRQCRAYVGSGEAQEDLDRIQAEGKENGNA